MHAPMKEYSTAMEYILFKGSKTIKIIFFLKNYIYKMKESIILAPRDCRMLLKIDCCGNVYYREIDIFSRRDGVNGPATFSTLKTYTGFDSTSVKSSGASLDFCYCGDNQILGRSQEKISHRCSCVIITVESVNDPFTSKTENRITATLLHMR